MPGNITNAWLARLLSIEFIGGVIIAVFTAGIIWNSLNAAIASNTEKLKDSTDGLEQVQGDVTELKTQTEVILVNQENAVKQLDGLSDEVEKIRIESAEERRIQREDIKQILHLLNGR